MRAICQAEVNDHWVAFCILQENVVDLEVAMGNIAIVHVSQTNAKALSKALDLRLVTLKLVFLIEPQSFSVEFGHERWRSSKIVELKERLDDKLGAFSFLLMDLSQHFKLLFDGYWAHFLRKLDL